RWVAIKLLPPDRATDPEMRSRFLGEARLAAKLSHPNIIPIHAVEEREGFVFFVMAFIDGETLTQRVLGRGPLTASEGIRVLREAAWALAYAHDQEVVHRDIKPDNILIESGSGRVLIADFGIAAALSDLTGGRGSGTPEFMSPEQVLGLPLDTRSDVYSLGASAYFAFSGRLPVMGETVAEILAHQVATTAVPLSSLEVAVPRKVASLVDRCLAKEPDQRPASAQALAEQLALAIEQRREAPPALRAFVKRSGRLDGGGTLVAGFLLIPAATAVSAWIGLAAGWATFVLGATILPIGYLVAAARRLRLLGFAHDDLAPAYRAEIDYAREELALGHRAQPTLAERILASVARIGGTLAGTSLAGLFVLLYFEARSTLPLFTFIEPLVLTFVLSFSAGVFAAIGYLALAQRRTDVESEFWSKIWLGRIGRGIFTLAGKFLRGRGRSVAMTHRATELSLGLAAEELFEQLPKASRAQLSELPVVLRRLQANAQSLRARYDRFQEALADLGDAGSSAAYADLRAARDEVHGKLGEAVGALETIRLDLLRLHAGAATIAGITTQLARATEVSEQVSRMVAAEGEVERLLAPPRPTPGGSA
ncbi:MAG TPA: serine/threonine-protein kinase, partial [Gemmatimonadales bacterium]|nr:serine/threonine-protein kinase [Gemmatimonadales bacterium]